jgi:hypothetical protein
MSIGVGPFQLQLAHLWFQALWQALRQALGRTSIFPSSKCLNLSTTYARTYLPQQGILPHQHYSQVLGAHHLAACVGMDMRTHKHRLFRANGSKKLEYQVLHEGSFM